MLAGRGRSRRKSETNPSLPSGSQSDVPPPESQAVQNPPLIQEIPATPTQTVESAPRARGRGKVLTSSVQAPAPGFLSTQRPSQRSTSISPTEQDTSAVFYEEINRETIVVETTQQQPRQSVLISQEDSITIPTIKPTGRGRGAFMSGSRQTASRLPGSTGEEERPVTSTPTRTPLSSTAAIEDIQTRLESTRITEQAFETRRPSTSTESSVKPPIPPARSQLSIPTSTLTPTPSKEKSGLASSAEDSSGRQQPTQMLSIATSSSMGKAADEIQVEHLVNDPPVKKLGTTGDIAEMSTNYVRLRCKNTNLYQYVVYFDPPQDSLRYRKGLIKKLQEKIGSVYLFDGLVLFSPKLVENFDQSTKLREDADPVTVSVRLTKMLPPENIPQNVFNIIFKNIMRELKMSRIGQHYFSSQRQISVPRYKLQIWPGFETSVHEYEDGLYLVIDVAHKVLRDQTCFDLMADLYDHSENDNGFRDAVAKELVGSIVLTRYNNKTYRVDDIDWESNPANEFEYRSGERTSYVAYYKKQYEINIRDRMQPLLINRPKKSKINPGNESDKNNLICLVPELCYLTGMSEDLRNDIFVKKDLSTHTRLSPSQRVDQLKNLIRAIRETPSAEKYLRDWGLELENDLYKLPNARILLSEKLYFGSRQVEVDAKCDWGRASGNEKVLSGVDITYWLCVYPANKENVVERFVSMAMESAKRVGIIIQSPQVVALRDDKSDTYYNEIKRYLNEKIQMVFMVFPNISDSRYIRVKRLCCVEYAVPSQVVVLKTIMKQDNQLRSVAQKVALQMNCKLGGELWSLHMPVKKVMIIGIDVYHKVEKRFQSIAGFVSSLNDDQTRWYSKVCFQMIGQELADALKPAFLQSLKKYHEVNNCFPDRIIVYRDGVSEGQLSTVYDHEISQFKSCFAKDYSPQMAVIVVQKRIGTRIFSRLNEREYVNPRPGTVIDHDITSKYRYDFYLVSQHVGQGTVTPTHYIVTYDDTKLKPDHLQRISYKMTHLYYNWSGTIRVPAPCQYAHKLAFLTGQYLQENPAEPLCNRLFYL